ncbi:MAG: hypothetical protein J5881_00445 [Clostridia bacterium]|nr:hypothetical protein [Clostridia bacterium]
MINNVSNKKTSGITLIALVITIIVLLIIAGITINAITGSESAPAKANEAEQKNDIGIAKDQISLTAVNTKTEAYETAYVGEGISSTDASNLVGRTVIKAVAEHIQSKNQYGKATVEITGFGDLNDITNDASITIRTRDLKVTGTILLQDGVLTWGEIGERTEEEQLELISSKINQGILSPLTDENPHSIKLKDAKGNKMVLPAGFEISSSNGDAANVAEGIIIQDEAGNQFVWVPVGTITEADGSKVTIPLGRYSNFISTNGNYTPLQGLTNGGYTPTTSAHLRESYYYEFAQKQQGETGDSESITITKAMNITNKPDGYETENTKAKNIRKFLESANRNGGFYIARYEAGIKGTASSNTSASQGGLTKNSATSGYIVSQADKGVWNKISQLNAATVCQNMYTTTTNPYVTSDLVNSYAWDTAVIFIQQCGGVTNYYVSRDCDGMLKKTGKKGDDVCHINDMASNVREWTTESSTLNKNPCVTRGGSYGNGAGTCSIGNSETGYNAENIGFRPILYL